MSETRNGSGVSLRLAPRTGTRISRNHPMGIDINVLKFLLSCRDSGVSFERPLLLGRHLLYLDDRARAEHASLIGVRDEYADTLFQSLGARVIDSIDASDYEGASIIHDLNKPVPSEWHGRYSVVFDGGTLEHIFDVPCALRSCMEMIAPGGHFVSATGAHGFMGHGFYQFSPELYFRVFSPENGFRVERMVAHNAYYESPWYEVADPDEVRSRVSISSPYPVHLQVSARRVERRSVFARPPQQSDYATAWHSHETQHADRTTFRPQRQSLIRVAVGAARSALRAHRTRRAFAKPWFKPART